MQIQQYGQRNPRLDRILITGGGNSGKTTLASKFATSPERTMFISTDGNALRQGYKGILFEYPENADKMLQQFKTALDIAYTDVKNFDVIVWDLVEDIDERMQVLLREEIDNYKTVMKAWGKINMFYKFAHSAMMDKFSDKTIVLLSRDIEEYYQKDDKAKNITKGDIKGYVPALRRVLKNIILKDQSVEIRCYFEQGKRKFDIENLRFEEMRGKVQEVINRPFVMPKTEHIAPKMCVDCNNEITATDKLSAAQIAAGTFKTYGVELCFECGAKRKTAKIGESEASA